MTQTTTKLVHINGLHLIDSKGRGGRFLFYVSRLLGKGWGGLYDLICFFFGRG